MAAIFSAWWQHDNPPLLYADGEPFRDFVHVAAIVQANRLAIATSRCAVQALNSGGGASGAACHLTA